MDYSEFYTIQKKKSIFEHNAITILIGLSIIASVIGFIFPEILPYVMFNLNNLMKYPWIIITSVFFHSGLNHLFFNCWSLYLFGKIIEQLKGKKFIWTLFFSSVIISNIFFGIFSPNTYGLGISGFGYALIASAVIFTPNIRIIVFPFPISIPIKIAGTLFFIFEIIYNFTLFDGIGHMAHIMGFLVGIIYSLIVKNKEPNIYNQY